MPGPSRRIALIAAVVAAAGAGAGALTFGASASVTGAHPYIVGGQSVTSPWVVQLEFTDGTDQFGCSGSAISPEWVLTAQHCIEGTKRMDVYFSNSVTNKGRANRVTEMKASPNGDVALVHLSSPVQLPRYGKLTDGYQPKAGETGQIAGYGLRANDAEPDHLHAARVTITGTARDAYEGQAVHITGVDGGSNHGDSGGPLWTHGAIVGVCSTGDVDDPGSDIHNGSNYANITPSRAWIKQTAGV